jgi:hypothetical protein
VGIKYMNKKTLQSLKEVIKYIKKEYKPCKSFRHDCGNCWVSYALSVLEEIVATEEWKEKTEILIKKFKK